MSKTASLHVTKSSTIGSRLSTTSSGKSCKQRRSANIMGYSSKSYFSTTLEGNIVNQFKKYYDTEDIDPLQEPIPVICMEEQIKHLFYIHDPKIIFVAKQPLAAERIEKAIFKNHPICDITLQAITGSIEKCKTLTNLKLEFCNLTPQLVSKLAERLYDTYITDLSLNGNKIDKHQNFHLLLEQPQLKSLSLKYCFIKPEGMKNIADKLTKPLHSLLILNLASNMLYDDGAEHVARMLRSNRSIMSLNLSDNKITNKGCKAVMLSLTEFELSPDEICFKRKRNFEKLKNALNSEPNLNEYVPDPPLTAKKSSSKSTFKDTSSGTVPTKKGSTKFKDKSATDAASQISTSSQNVNFDPDYHPFINDVIEDQQTILCKGNDVLINLNLSYNNIHKEGAQAIVDTLYHQQQLFAADRGLSRITTEGNNFHNGCLLEVDAIEDILAQKARRRSSVRSRGSSQRKSSSKVSLLPQIT